MSVPQELVADLEIKVRRFEEASATQQVCVRPGRGQCVGVGVGVGRAKITLSRIGDSVCVLGSFWVGVGSFSGTKQSVSALLALLRPAQIAGKASMHY